MSEEVNCSTCRHEISSVCFECDPQDKSKGWEPKEKENNAVITKENFQIEVGSFDIYVCSNCNKNDIKTNYKYCPFCGIKLRFSLE
jgi:hypothetical protein